MTFTATFVCMLLLSASGTIFFARPFESKFISYFGNNIFWAMIVGPVLFALIFTPAIKSGFVYGQKWDRRLATATK